MKIAVLGVGHIGSTVGRLWHAAAADLHKRFKFLGDTGVWRLLTSAARDIG